MTENPSPNAFRLRALERIGFKSAASFAPFVRKYTAIKKNTCDINGHILSHKRPIMQQGLGKHKAQVRASIRARNIFYRASFAFNRLEKTSFQQLKDSRGPKKGVHVDEQIIIVFVVAVRVNKFYWKIQRKSRPDRLSCHGASGGNSTQYGFPAVWLFCINCWLFCINRGANVFHCRAR